MQLQDRIRSSMCCSTSSSSQTYSAHRRLHTRARVCVRATPNKNWAGAAQEGGELGQGAAAMNNMQRLKMQIAYDGTEFAGFQWQPGKVRTVQGELERAAKRLFLGSSRMVGASRTDAGAHANGQVAHFDVHGSRDSLASDLMMFNGFLPGDVKVVNMDYGEPGFDSHFSSLGKSYLYRISTGTPHPMQTRYSWWIFSRYCERSRGKPLKPSDLHLDVPAMREAAAFLIGTHDFSAMMDQRRPSGLGNVKRKKPHLVAKGIKPVRTKIKNIRTLGELSIEEDTNAITGGQDVQINLTGDGFLYHMVRVIAAALVEVGHGRISPDKLSQAFTAGDRSVFGEAAPPHGLYLERVWYPEGKEDMIARCTDAAARSAMEAALLKKEQASLNGGVKNEEGEEEGSSVSLVDDDGDGPLAAVRVSPAVVKFEESDSAGSSDELTAAVLQEQ